MAITSCPMHKVALERHERSFAAEARIAELVGAINTATAALVDTIADVLANDLWHGPSIHSPEHWVTWQCGVTPGRAAALVTTARRMADLPVCAATFRAGELTGDQMAAIARHTPSERDTEVAQLATALMVPQLARALRKMPKPPPQPDDKPATPPREPTREVSFGFRDDGWFWSRMLLPPDEGAVWQKVFEAGRDVEFAERYPDADAEQARERRCDISWADGACRAAEAAAAGFASLMGRTAAERYQVLLHVDVDQPEFPSHLHLGPALSPGMRRLLSCDATLRTIFEQAGIPIGYGRSRRTVGPLLRKIIEDRDGGCRVPGCSHTRWLHIHHLVHWEDGGPTDPGNLLALCPLHHRLHHMGLLDITGDPNRLDGLTFIDSRTGWELKPPPPRPVPPDGLGLPPPTWNRPAGERLALEALSWN